MYRTEPIFQLIQIILGQSEPTTMQEPAPKGFKDQILLCLEKDHKEEIYLHLYWEQLSSWHKRLLPLLRQIPRGSVTTYKDLATKLGQPKGARAVGRGMATNPFPLLFPCHRIINANGSLGGFSPSIDIKTNLLLREGVLVKNNQIFLDSINHG